MIPFHPCPAGLAPRRCPRRHGRAGTGLGTGTGRTGLGERDAATNEPCRPHRHLASLSPPPFKRGKDTTHLTSLSHSLSLSLTHTKACYTQYMHLVIQRKRLGRNLFFFSLLFKSDRTDGWDIFFWANFVLVLGLMCGGWGWMVDGGGRRRVEGTMLGWVGWVLLFLALGWWFVCFFVVVVFSVVGSMYCGCLIFFFSRHNILMPWSAKLFRLF